MKYKKGDQFVIEIGDVLTDANNERVYKIKGFRSLVFDDNGLDRLDPIPLAQSMNDWKIGYKTAFRDIINATTETLAELEEG